MYHGSPEERAELRRTQMILPGADRERYWLGAGTAAAAPILKPSKGGKKKPTKAGSSHTNGRTTNAHTTKAKTKKAEDGDEDEQPEDPDSHLPPHQKTTFPVVITTYEIVMRDRAELGMYRWGFVVVDEGHRLKNMDCRLMRELKSLNADSRMVLTGTPLHVRLIPLRMTECN